MAKGGQELVYCSLGGAGEIGMNLNLFGYGKPGEYKWIIVDIGVTFSDDNIPGIEVILPNPEFIANQKEKFTWNCFNACTRRSCWSNCAFVAYVGVSNLCNSIYSSNC
jgi:hypothetical protein